MIAYFDDRMTSAAPLSHSNGIGNAEGKGVLVHVICSLPITSKKRPDWDLSKSMFKIDLNFGALVPYFATRCAASSTVT